MWILFRGIRVRSRSDVLVRRKRLRLFEGSGWGEGRGGRGRVGEGGRICGNGVRRGFIYIGGRE